MGRPKGSRNKTSALNRAKVGDGLMPIDYMLNVLRSDESTPEQRRWAAVAAAPYVHPKLANVEVGNAGGKPFEVKIAGSDTGLL